MPDPNSYQHDLHQLADDAEALQAKVNLQAGWAAIALLPNSPMLYQVNAKLVEVARQLRQTAQQTQESQAVPIGSLQAERPVADRVTGDGD